MQKFNIDDVIDFYVKTINVPENTKIQVGLTPLDINKKSFNDKKIEDTTMVKKYDNEYIAEYPFIPKDIIKELSINENEVFYIKGWLDANNDKKISRDTEEEVIFELVKDVFIGFIHKPINNKVHLLTKKDIEKYKLNSINPVTQALEGKHPILAGSASIYAGLYGFGDWASRISGFRDWQLDNIDNEEQDKSLLETKYILKLMKYIAFNENGTGELFAKSVEKYVKENPTYVTSRFLTGYGISKLINTGIVPKTSFVGQVTFSAKEVDDFARAIILGQ